MTSHLHLVPDFELGHVLGHVALRVDLDHEVEVTLRDTSAPTNVCKVT